MFIFLLKGKMHALKSGLVAGIATVLLTACGGGGGGTTSSAPSTVVLGGVAAKGILMGAEATAYELGADGKLGDELGSVTTGADGSYSFSLPATERPVVVKIASIPGTTMKDESVIDPETGDYQVIDAPTGLSLRTMVDSLTFDREEVHANPFTEAAVAGAENTRNADGDLKPLSESTFAAARSMMKQLLGGVYPESIKPLAIGASPMPTERQAMTLLTGLMADGVDEVANKLETLTAAMQLQENAEGLTGMADATAVLDFMSTVSTDGAAKLDDLGLTDFKDDTDYDSINLGAVNSAVEVERNSLDGFVTAMKAGLKSTDTTLKEAQDAFDARVKDVAFDQFSEQLGNALKAIDYSEVTTDDAGYLVLSPTCGADCGFTLAKTAAGTYTVTPKDTTTQGSSIAYGRLNDADGTLDMRYSGSVTQPIAGNFDINLKVSGLENGELHPTDGMVTIPTFLLSGVSDGGEFSATVKLTNGKISRVVTDTKKEYVVSAQAIEISTTKGDSLKGALTELRNEEVDGLWSDVTRVIDANLTGTLGNTQMLSAKLLAKNDTPAEALINGEGETGSLSLDLQLVEGTRLVMGMSKSTDGETMKVVLTGNGNTITAESDAEGGLTLTSSTGAYKAVLDADRNGDLFAGNTKIGVVTNGVLYYDGIEVSLF